MRTVSRVLSANDDAVEPVPWRNGAHAGRAIVHKDGALPNSAHVQASAELQASIEQQVQGAFDAGLREGESAARRQMEAELRRAVEQFGQAAAEVAAFRRDAVRHAEAQILQLSIEIARRIMHRELSFDSSALAAPIKAALEKLGSQEMGRVRVHPSQEEFVRSVLEQSGRSPLEVLGDPSQPLGAVIFEGPRGSLDASLETQLLEIERTLAHLLEERQ